MTDRFDDHRFQEIMGALGRLEIISVIHSEMLAHLDKKTDKIMSVQSDIDAATAQINALVSDVATNVSTLVNTDIPAIQAALAAIPASVDTTALDAAVTSAANTAASLDSATQNVGTLVPAPAGS